MKNLSVLTVSLLVGGFSASPVRAQTTGTFSPTGHLTVERMYHTATLLTNGKVLVAGGFAILSGWPVWSTAELYDPSTGTFSSASSMTTSRFGHTATRLPDGRVLIAGGDSSTPYMGYGSSAQASAELYDPATGLFTATGAMNAARTYHSATLLNTGNVLISGGFVYDAQGNQISLASAELYDPSMGTFTPTGSMSTPRAWFTATLLANGKVLVDGGANSEPTAELYDPAAGLFSPAGPSAYPNYVIPTSASLLTNGDVLETEEVSCDFGDQAELYDPTAGTFAATANMTTSRGYVTSTLLPEGRVLIDGRDGSHIGGSAELYDPVAAAFMAAPGELPESEEGHTATLLPDGTVLLAGGWICCGYSVANAEIYLPAVLIPSPILYSLPGGTSGAILHGLSQQVVSPSNPAMLGEVLEIFGAGLIEGSSIPPQVSIGGLLAEVLFFGDAPGFPGLNQINVIVPDPVQSGSGVSVRLNYLNRPSNEVTLSVQ
jgi:hypothetical protein